MSSEIIRLAINAVPYAPGGGMVGLLGYLEAWKEIDAPLEIVVYASRQEVIDAITEVRPNVRIVPFALGQRPIIHFIKQQTRLGRLIARTEVDLVWSPQYGICASPVPQVVYHTNLLRFTHPTLVSRIQERSCFHFRESIVDIAARSALRKAAKNVFISDYMRQVAESTIPESKERNVVIQNGLASSWNREMKRGEALWAGAPRLIAIQHSAAHKDNPTLIKLLAHLKKRAPEVPWSLDVAGNGDWMMTKMLAKQLGVLENIRFHGYLGETALKSLIRLSFCLVFTSILEGFGLPPLEAMACGCPVVACDCTAMPEVIGDAGILVEPGSANGFAAAILRLWEDKGLRDKYVQEGLQRSRIFTWENSARKMYHVFQQVAKGNDR